MNRTLEALLSDAFHQPNGKLPLMLGVTGHRDLRPEDLPALRKQVSHLLQEVQNHWSKLQGGTGTPIYVLSGLAVGADQLTAEVALEMGIGVIAVLPFPQKQYEKDFKSKSELARLRSLVKASAKVVTIPSRKGKPEHQYEAAGSYISRNCSVLIALWDGVHIDKVGGTSHVVRMKLFGSDSNVDGPLQVLEFSNPGPVCHIHTPRQSSAQRPDLGIRILRKSEEGSETLPVPFDNNLHLLESLKRQGEFNGDWTRLAPKLSHLTKTADRYLLPITLPGDNEEHLRTYYGIADTLASHFQKLSIRVVKAYFGLLLLAGVILETSYYLFPVTLDHHEKTVWLELSYVIAMGLIGAVYFYSKKNEFHNRYHEYRALAEALRVQLFWRIAGIPDPVSEHYLAHQVAEMDWICKAMYSVNLPLTGPPAPNFAILQEHWLKDQLKFFKSSVRKNSKFAKRFNLAGLAALIVSFVWIFLRLSAEGLYKGANPGEKWLITLVVMVLASTSVLALVLFGYNHFRGFPEHAKRHSAMIPLFEMAIRVMSQPTDPVLARQVVLQIGREALAENGYWLILHHQQEFDLS